MTNAKLIFVNMDIVWSAATQLYAIVSRVSRGSSATLKLTSVRRHLAYMEHVKML